MSPLYRTSIWADTYALKLPVVLTDNLAIEEGVLPPGERIERGKKATKRKAAGRRAQIAPEIIDFSGLGSQITRGERYEPTGRNHGYTAIGTQGCRNCGGNGHNRLSCTKEDRRLLDADELPHSPQASSAAFTISTAPTASTSE